MSTRAAARLREARELLEDFRLRCVRLWREGDGIGYEAPPGVLTRRDAAQVKELKPEVLELLWSPEPTVEVLAPQAEAYVGELFYGAQSRDVSPCPLNDADSDPARRAVSQVACFEPGTAWTELPEPLVSHILRQELNGHALTDEELPVLMKALRQARRRLGARASSCEVHAQAVHFALVELGRDPAQCIADILLARRREELAPSEPAPAHREGRRQSARAKARGRRPRRGSRAPVLA